ncbi:S1 RNA-binding domain-containing protein [Anaerolineales bacterium HSG6]|nr:S1 RNA-binding domain-containing protein [Anaerolineales bacterium HSG6]
MSDKIIETEPTEVVDSTPSQEPVAEVSPTAVDTEPSTEKITPEVVTDPVEASTDEPDKSVEEGSTTEAVTAEVTVTEEASSQEPVAEVSPTAVDTEPSTEKITPEEVTEPVEVSTDEPDKSVEEGSTTEAVTAEVTVTEEAVTEETVTAETTVTEEPPQAVEEEATEVVAKAVTKNKTEATTPPKKKKRRKKLTPEEEESILALKKGQHMAGKVKNITEFGAFVDLGIAQDGLVHISQLSRHKVEKPEDVVTEGQEVDVWVKKVDKKRGRISLTMVRPVTLRFKDIAADAELEGTVTRLEPYGAFIDISSERDGLVHISEITHEYIKHPEDVLTVEEKVKIKVLKVDHKKRQVDLSIKALLPEPPPKEVPATNKRSNSPRKSFKKPQVPVIEEVPMVTAMAAAFSSLKDGDSASAANDRHVRNRAKQKKAMASVLDRTLAVETPEP